MFQGCPLELTFFFFFVQNYTHTGTLRWLGSYLGENNLFRVGLKPVEKKLTSGPRPAVNT